MKDSRAATPPWALLAVPAAAAVAWFATSLRPFTAPALVVTLGAGGLALVAGSRTRHRDGEPSVGRWLGAPAGLVVWGVLAASLAAWELAAFVQLPRSEHPTLSSLANAVFAAHAVRAAAFLAWMAAGFGIARR
ncbi:MAG TPA: hypothetical protein VHJ78_06675 [Actinomycetota bacterium]|nr:hypothetical protein [Actinomycetota bacterium]